MTTSPCHECGAPCCRELVRLMPHDLVRLVDTLGVPWALVARAIDEPDGLVPLGGGRRVSFALRQQGSGACVLLLELPGGLGRCGLHAARPSRCRIYPYHVAVGAHAPDVQLSYGLGARCPPESELRWREAAAGTSLDDDLAERALATRVLARWRSHLGDARVEPQDFVEWAAQLYGLLAPLRRGERQAWQLDAYRVVDAAPPPRALQRALPMAPSAASPCFGCATPCCFEYEVPVSGFDVWRLCRALDVPWSAVVSVKRALELQADSVRLDASAHVYTLWLRKKPNGACVALDELPGQQHRCGAHAGRPLACRAYPMQRIRPQPGVALPTPPLTFIDHALCPPPQRRAWSEAKAPLWQVIDDEYAESALYQHVARRWNQMARHVPRNQTIAADELFAWLFALYDRLQPLRLGPRAEWEPLARALIDSLPLPSLFTSGV